MDDTDKQIIEEHFAKLENDNLNLINNNNDQIIINTDISKNLKHLSEILNESNIEIARTIRSYQTRITRIEQVMDQLHFETMIRNNINFMINEIKKIKDILLTSRLNILSRDILTYEEIQKNNITLHQLPEIRLKIALYNHSLLLILSIPNFGNNTYKELLTKPVPNKMISYNLSLNTIQY